MPSLPVHTEGLLSTDVNEFWPVVKYLAAVPGLTYPAFSNCVASSPKFPTPTALVNRSDGCPVSLPACASTPVT